MPENNAQAIEFLRTRRSHPAMLLKPPIPIRLLSKTGLLEVDALFSLVFRLFEVRRCARCICESAYKMTYTEV